MIVFSLKNRIAFYYLISTALLILVVFISIYSYVSYTVQDKLNQHINYKIEEHVSKIDYTKNEVILADKQEWYEREHNEVNVNPVFLQITNSQGDIIEKSENLKNKTLLFTKNLNRKLVLDSKLANKKIRQVQLPLIQSDKIKGYLLIAVSMEETVSFLYNLKKILFSTYLLVLLLLFLVARFIAGSTIKPINAIIKTSSEITKDNLKGRIELPQNRDELYTLSQTINSLLDRIENTIEREKQFTSYASHELRTPLAVIKGTMEVLIRKPRNQEEYQEKINFCIREVDRLNYLVDQLLLLARFENQKQNIKKEWVDLKALILDNLTQFSDSISNNDIEIKVTIADDLVIQSDYYLFSIIMSNLLSNAIKYSNEKSTIAIAAELKNKNTVLTITDSGMGIPNLELDKILHSFYRSETVQSSNIKGTGLGLSIVKRLCLLLKVEMDIQSQLGIGTTVTLIIPNLENSN